MGFICDFYSTKVLKLFSQRFDVSLYVQIEKKLVHFGASLKILEKVITLKLFVRVVFVVFSDKKFKKITIRCGAKTNSKFSTLKNLNANEIINFGSCNKNHHQQNPIIFSQKISLHCAAFKKVKGDDI